MVGSENMGRIVTLWFARNATGIRSLIVHTSTNELSATATSFG